MASGVHRQPAHMPERRAQTETMIRGGARAELLGLSFEPMTMDAVVGQCLEWCRGVRSPHTVITANAAHLCMMRRDPGLDAACRSGDLIVADGMSVVWALRAAGVEVPERVAGVDLMTRLLEAGGDERLRVYFLGARPEVVERLAEAAARRYPGLVVAGYRDGYFSPADHEAVVEEIRGLAPHLLFIGMPSPFKEMWIQRHGARLGVPVMIGVGGSFDVLAGFIPRAPRRMQQMGLEWFWRLIKEPRKLWKRYLRTNTEFLWLAGREILARRLAGRPAAERLQRDPNA
jgi:N-acetylglucosaminyldiphosphoundecaprenol N-acetyl-beta-D-mannosaminyltransferase